MSVAACSLWAGGMSHSAKQGNLLCAIAQRVLWVSDGMGYSGSQCCLLSSSYKDQELAGIYSSHPAWWSLLLSSPVQRGGGGNAMACGPHADCPPCPRLALDTAERSPALWWSGRGFLPPTCKGMSSLAPRDTAQLLRIRFGFWQVSSPFLSRDVLLECGTNPRHVVVPRRVDRHKVRGAPQTGARVERWSSLGLTLSLQSLKICLIF